jgi:hypothetical protein
LYAQSLRVVATTLFLCVNIKKIEEKNLILISKEIAHKLHNEYGVRFGENGISTSKTKYKKYYLCESSRNLGLLKRLNKTK